jgi:hypothetical protein
MILGFCAVLFGSILILRYGLLDWVIYRNQYAIGNQIILRVELFRTERGRLPESLDELDLREIGVRDPLSLNVYYNKLDEDRYVVSFPLVFALGESIAYDSKYGKWQ